MVLVAVRSVGGGLRDVVEAVGRCVPFPMAIRSNCGVQRLSVLTSLRHVLSALLCTKRKAWCDVLCLCSKASIGNAVPVWNKKKNPQL